LAAAISANVEVLAFWHRAPAFMLIKIDDLANSSAFLKHFAFNIQLCVQLEQSFRNFDDGIRDCAFVWALPKQLSRKSNIDPHLLIL
jgi:hypothetical protein